MSGGPRACRRSSSSWSRLSRSQWRPDCGGSGDRDTATEPLGKLTVARIYGTKCSVTKGTKTEAVKLVPVHPTLTAMLAEWKLSG